MSATGIAVVLLVAGIGAFVQGSVGFGHNLIAAPVFALVDDRLVPGPAIASAGVLVLMTVVRDRQGLHLGEVGTALVGRVPGTVLAAIAVASLPADTLATGFAALVLIAVAITASGAVVRPTRPTLFAAGALSGFMGTATSIGGPPMAMLYAGEEGRRLRGTLAGFFLVGILMSLVALVAAGTFGAEEARLSLLPVPAIALGFAASSWGARRLDAGHTRPAVLVVAAVSALSVLVEVVR
ncbi:MAG TPA: sulfite exporter TauE/SafE family protein [Acidimicrobiales bacterium]|nr:sulfite exporter TauE/SafE family protein [Acidimicrobiales bacterium]